MVSLLDDSEIDYILNGKTKDTTYRLLPPQLSETVLKVRVFLPEIYRVGSADTLNFSFVAEGDDEESDSEEETDETTTSTDDSSTTDTSSTTSTTSTTSDTSGATSTSDDSSTDDIDSESEDDEDEEDSSSSTEEYNAIKLTTITAEEELKKIGNRNMFGDNELQEAVADEEDEDEEETEDTEETEEETEETEETSTPVYNVTPDEDILEITDNKRVLDFDESIIELSFEKDYEDPDGSCSFKVPYTESNNLNLKRGARIIVREGYRYPNGTEDIKEVFSGYIDEVEESEGIMEVKAKDLGELLNTTLEVEYSGMERQEIMEDIIENKIGLKSDIDFYGMFNDVIDFSTSSSSDSDDDSDDDDSTYSGTVSADVKKAAKQIVGSSTGKKALKKLYKWVATNIEYEYYNNSSKYADGTLSSRGGNCCDQANLMVAMARAVGIKAQYMYGTSCRFLDGTFNHIWGRYKVGGSWFECDTVSGPSKGWGSTAASYGCASTQCKGDTLGF